MNQFSGQPVLYLNCDMQAPELVQLEGSRVAAFSTRCPDKPTPNEDSAAIVPVGEDSCVLIVADGMGGHSAGDIASKTAIESMVSAIRACAGNGDRIRTGILNGFEQAHAAVQALGVGAGTTLAVVEIDNDVVRAYHAGDSIVVVCGNKGKVKHQTVPHSVVGFGVEAGLIESEDALHHEESHIVLNAVGLSGMRVEIGPPVKLSKRDTVLLATDGLADNLIIDEMVETIRKGNLDKAMCNLRTRCQNKMLTIKPDDVAMVLFRRSR